jgi:Helix-turn-helix domain
VKKAEVTLAEAAEELRISQKTVTRLILSGKLTAEKRRVKDGKRRGRRRWIIDRVHLNRYRLIHGGWNDQRGPVPSLDGFEENFGWIRVYGQWGQRPYSQDRLITHTVAVSIDEFWQLACVWPSSEAEYEDQKERIRVKLPGRPETFQVRFVFNQSAQKELERLVRIAKCPQLGSISPEELQKEAFMHVVLKVLPHLVRIKKNWRAYIVTSVKRFYIDKARAAKKLDPLNYLADAAESDNLWYASTPKRPKASD